MWVRTPIASPLNESFMVLCIRESLGGDVPLQRSTTFKIYALLYLYSLDLCVVSDSGSDLILLSVKFSIM